MKTSEVYEISLISDEYGLYFKHKFLLPGSCMNISGPGRVPYSLALKCLAYESLRLVQNSGTKNLIDPDGCDFTPNTGANKLS